MTETATLTEMTENLVLELCAGYNGLGMAVEAALAARVAAFSEFDKAPSKILAYRYPGVPNFGDMTCIDWAELDRKYGKITVISGGTPCQDLSHAGRRRGMTEGTRSNLWVNMREAIAIIQPEWVVWENVRGAYSAEATSELEHCAGCMGDAADRGTVLRALGRVLGDLSDLGYDTKWRGLRAADVGAPHSRFRVFVLAHRRATAHDPGSIRGDQALEHHGSSAAPDDRAGLPDQSDREFGGTGPLGDTPPHTCHLGHEGPLPGGDGTRPRSTVAGSGGAPRDADGADGEGSLSAGDATVRGSDQAREDRGAGSGPADAPLQRGDAQPATAAREGHLTAGGRGGSEPHADAESLGRGEGRTQSARVKGRHDAPLSSDAPTPDTSGIPDGQHGGGPSEEETGPHAGNGPRHPDRERPLGNGGEATPDTISEHRGQRRQPAPGEEESGQPSAQHPGRSGALATPDTDGRRDLGRVEDEEREPEHGETPTGHSGGSHPPLHAADDDSDGSPDPGAAGRRKGSEERPTPDTDGAGSEACGGRPGAGVEGRREPVERSGEDTTNWGVYAAAIERWERLLGRPAPRPTEPTGRNNGQRLSARFTEWMMGLPDGWVTDPEIGISRNEQLKACGNGVVPQQAYAAIVDMLEEYWTEWELEAAA